jgi:hypothetical protein
MKPYRPHCFGLALLLTALVLPACSQAGKDEMVPIGPEVQADLVIYFKGGVANEQISKFWHEVLSNPHPSGRGTWTKDGISGISAVFPPIQGHEGVAVSFYRTATEAQRAKVKADVNASPLVYKVFENVAPKDVKTLD